MFLLRKNKNRRSRSNKAVSLYYLLAGICFILGMIMGIFNVNTDISYILPESTDSIYVFKFSLLKHTILLLLIFINSFSVIGIPVNSGMLIICGYFISVSTFALFAGSEIDKIHFIINNFPQTALILTAVFLFSVAAFEFSHYLLTFMMKAGYRTGFYREFRRLIVKFVLCLVLIAIASAYEAFVL